MKLESSSSSRGSHSPPQTEEKDEPLPPAQEVQDETPQPQHTRLTREALETAAAAAELSTFTSHSSYVPPAEVSQRLTPLSFTGTTVSTVRAPPIRKRPRLNAGSRPVSSSTPSISYHIRGINEATCDRNETFDERDEKRYGQRTLRDEHNPSFILRRG